MTKKKHVMPSEYTEKRRLRLLGLSARKWLRQWKRDEKKWVERIKNEEIATAKGKGSAEEKAQVMSDALYHFEASRSFAGLGSVDKENKPKFYESVYKLALKQKNRIQDPTKPNDTPTTAVTNLEKQLKKALKRTLAKEVERLSEKSRDEDEQTALEKLTVLLDKPAGSLLSASSKLIWLFTQKNPLFDSWTCEALSLAGTRDYEEFVRVWNKEYRRHTTEIEIVLSELMSNLSDYDDIKYIEKRWFRKRVFDKYLLRVAKNAAKKVKE